MYVQYKRTHEFQAAHFNEGNYLRFEGITGIDKVNVEKRHEWIYYPDPIECQILDLISLVQDSHGHNFKAEVELMGEVDDSYSSYILADEVIISVINEWAGINLSVHPDFLVTGVRATTENMAQKLCKKIFDKVEGRKSVTNIVVNVTIHESDDISSTAVRTSND